MRERALEDLEKSPTVFREWRCGQPERSFLHRPNVPEMRRDGFSRGGSPCFFLRFALSIIPYATPKNHADGYVIRKDGHAVHIWPSIIDFDDLDRLVETLSGVKNGKSIAEIKRLSTRIEKETPRISRVAPVRWHRNARCIGVSHPVNQGDKWHRRTPYVDIGVLAGNSKLTIRATGKSILVSLSETYEMLQQPMNLTPLGETTNGTFSGNLLPNTRHTIIIDSSPARASVVR